VADKDDFLVRADGARTRQYGAGGRRPSEPFANWRSFSALSR